MNTKRENKTHSLSQALRTLQVLMALVKRPPFNLDRFEACKIQIFNLPLPAATKQRHQKILARASRYVEFGELGAVHFELKLLARNLESLLESKCESVT